MTEERELTLEEQVAALEAERDEHLNDLKRVAAEFENYRKRVLRDQESLVARAHERLVKELLPVLDDLERALAAAEEHEEAKLEEGVRLVHRELADALAREGLAEIETNGVFDPHVHEALLSQPSDQDEGSVLEVVQKGYRLGDRVLRPARVVVAAAAGGRWRQLRTCTGRSASRRARARTRSRRRTASSRASTTRTRTRATTPRRSASRRSRAPTTCSRIPRSGSSTTASAPPTAAGRARAGVNFEGFDFADLGDLGDIFGGLFGARGRAQQQPRGQRGSDLEVEVRLSFDDSLKGVETTIPVELETACRECNGSGARPGTAPVLCPECHGRGVISESQGLFALSQPCPRCRGNGTVIEEPCPNCRGTGRERRTKRYTVKIPAGVKDGSRIRLRGKGEAGWGGAEAGDLYVVTRVAPSDTYTRRGDDLVVDVPVTYPEATLGAQVQVPTPDGPVTVKVKPGTEDGTLLRVKGKGAPKLKGSGRGNVLARVKLTVPKKLSKQEREAIEALREASG